MINETKIEGFRLRFAKKQDASLILHFIKELAIMRKC